jgi:hypothetical protein
VQEKLNITDEEHLEPMDAFVEALARPEGSRLPCDFVLDPVRSCATLAIVRSMIDGPERVGAGLDGDMLVQNILVPQEWVHKGSKRLGDALGKLSEQFPAAVVTRTTAALVGGASGGSVTNEASTTKIEGKQEAVTR